MTLDGQRLELLDWSVVIPAYRGRQWIVDCIRSVERALRGHAAEIVVVESSGDGTAELIRRTFPAVRVLAQKQRVSAGAARNLGAAEARGKLIAFVDQDCIVPNDWIDRLEELLMTPGVGAAGGSIGIRNPRNLSGAAVYFLEFLSHFPSNRAVTKNSNFLLGCNLACHREVLDHIQFPDRTLAEDVLFSEAVRQQGWDLMYAPQIEVQHWNREGWTEFLRYNEKMGRAAAHYHQVRKHRLSRAVISCPAIALCSPLVIVPRVSKGLWGRWKSLLGFLALSPVCVAGNLFWSIGLFRELRRMQRNVPHESSTDLPPPPTL
jgi:GT2 family glycosyltransferase